MAKATWNNATLAESSFYEIVEGNIYFPPDSIHKEYFKPSDHHTHCPWKGDASYYHVEVHGKINENAAWYYPNTREAASHIKNHVAFWNGVDVTE